MFLSSTTTPHPTPGLSPNSIAASHPYVIRYVHEPEPGIPVARNRAVHESLALGADWIAFIDDDEEARPGWLKNLLTAGERFGADVIQGKLVKIYPETLPRFVTATQYRDRQEGGILPTAYTYNVAFRSWLVHPERAALRFDEALRFTGGSDSEFFGRAYRIGAKIFATETSVVTEEQPPERLTFRWQLEREERVAAGIVERERRFTGTVGSMFGRKFKIYRRLAEIWLQLLLSPFLILTGWQNFEKRFVHVRVRLARAMGTLRGLRGALPEPYRRLDGY